jgi:hypothetical protein
MARRAQVFAASHAGALTRADALDAGRTPPDNTPSCDVPGIGPLDLELLGEIAARIVRFGWGDVEPSEVDLDHEMLYLLPPFLVEVLVELNRDEEGSISEVVEAWLASSETDPNDEAQSWVRDVIEVAVAAEAAGRNVYLWVAQD